ncbi:MAG UNVERIFIED_CONTAM: hypothetical protein LVR18_25320 [Planctomycetaceae bacterium]
MDWREVIPLPFELACVPQKFYAALRLPVVEFVRCLRDCDWAGDFSETGALEPAVEVGAKGQHWAFPAGAGI